MIGGTYLLPSYRNFVTRGYKYRVGPLRDTLGLGTDLPGLESGVELVCERGIDVSLICMQRNVLSIKR